MTNYVDALFNNHARLLVVRLDLHYRKTLDPLFITEEMRYMECAQARIDLDHLFDNTRSNSLFNNMLGHMCKFEYGFRKGAHFHLIFFFDGSQVREDISIATRIGEYWNTVITNGRGHYHNCNLNKDTYDKCGIGMINYHESEKRNILKNEVIAYLTKPDFYIGLFYNGRTLFRGTMPQAAVTNNRGRPREYCDQYAV